MNIKPIIKNFLWMAGGAVILLLIILLVMRYQTKQNPSEQLVFKANCMELLSRMRLTLTTASEAEKSAVIAVTEQDSKIFADQARKATIEVEKDRIELTELLNSGGTQNEKDSLIQFSKAFAAFLQVDSTLLDIAVKHTNIKAYSLAFGPATDAIKEMDNSLSVLVEKTAALQNAKDIKLLAYGAQISALSIQTLLAPHISEESEKKMDELEASISKEDMNVRKNLNYLAAIQNLRGDPLLDKSVSAYARFTGIRNKILSLSRENTDIRSFAISLGQKRKILFLCQDILSSLQKAISDEPISGINYGFMSNPRTMQKNKSNTGK
jgi:hypothetical protein